jgi:hypothetical protein
VETCLRELDGFDEVSEEDRAVKIHSIGAAYLDAKIGKSSDFGVTKILELPEKKLFKSWLSKHLHSQTQRLFI